MAVSPRAQSIRFAFRLLPSACLAVLISAAAIPARAQQPPAEPPALTRPSAAAACPSEVLFSDQALDGGTEHGRLPASR